MTTNRQKRANRGAGFTLVEILVVIVIIGLLAGITSTVLVSARNAARSSVVATQMSQLSMALDEYKNQYGEYPPDFSDPAAVMRHVKKRWPRYDVPGNSVAAQYAEFMRHVRYGCMLSSGTIDAPGGVDVLDGRHVWDLENQAYVSSLIFWLGGLPDYDGKPSGFYANPKAPLGVGYNSADLADGSPDVLVPLAFPFKARREAPLFDFELKNVGYYICAVNKDSQTGLVDEARGYPIDDPEAVEAYAPVFQQGDLPIVYFRPSANTPYGTKSFCLADSDDAENASISRAVPYMRDAQSGAWFEDKRFQMIHPGVDGLFGPDENYDEPRNPANGDETILAGTTQLSGEDDDNIVNFAENGTLVSEYEN